MDDALGADMNRSPFALVCPSLVLLCLAGCETHKVRVDLSGFERPALIGDRIHIGEGPGPEVKSLEQTFEGEASWSSFSAAGSYDEPAGPGRVRTVTYSVYEERTQSDVGGAAAAAFRTHPIAGIMNVEVSLGRWAFDPIFFLMQKIYAGVEGDVILVRRAP